MSWDTRQRGMLAAMGLRVWGEPVAHAAVIAAPPASEPVPLPVNPPAVSVPQRASTEQSPPGNIPHLAHWMVVGEPQSAPEAESGLPFGGDAGHLLDNMLLAIGVSRGADGGSAGGSPASQAFLTHALKSSQTVDGSPVCSSTCAPYLQQQMSQVQPQIILAMGAHAAQALLGSAEPVGKLRGRVHRCQGLPVIVTYDPTYLLRSPADKAGAWADLCLACDTLAQAAEAP